MPSPVLTPAREPSLRLLLSLGYGLLVLALGTVLALGIEHGASGALEREVDQRLQATARSLAGRLRNGIDERRADAQTLAATDAVRRLDAEGARVLFDHLQQATPELAWIGLADVDGRVIASTGGLLEGADVSARPWFQEGQRGEFLGDVHDAVLLASKLPQVNGQPLRFVDVSLPIRDADDRVHGVLGLHLSWAWAGRLTRELAGEDAGQSAIRVLAADGEVLLGPVMSAPWSRPHEADGGGRQGDTLRAWADAGSRAPLGGLGWQVLVEQPVDQALAGVQALRQTILLGSAAAVLLAVIAGIWLARLIGDPMRRLATAAERHRRGDPGARIPLVGGYREARQLGVALADLVEDLGAFASELEQRVAQRTAELAAANQRLELLSATDPLTGLANRRHFSADMASRMRGLRAGGAPVALLLLDIDHFKRINDTHGHPAGDFVLRTVADLLRESARDGELVARIGGEEFALLASDVDRGGAMARAAALRARLAQRMPLEWDGASIDATVSIGMALATAVDPALDDTLAGEALYARADAGLYAAKRGGRDRAEWG